MRYTHRYASTSYYHESERGVLTMDAPGMICHITPATDTFFHEVVSIVVSQENSEVDRVEVIEIVRLSDDGTWPVVFAMGGLDGDVSTDRGFENYTTEPTVLDTLYRSSWYTQNPWVWRPMDGEGITMVLGGANPRIGVRLASTPPSAIDIQGQINVRSLWAK